MSSTVRQLINALDTALRSEGAGRKQNIADFDESIAEDYKVSDYSTMAHDIIRDALERELDLLQGKFERLLGREAARETFARRASALGEGAPDLGMAARETTKPEPQLTEAELAAFRAHAAAHPWDKRVCSPNEYITATFEKWLGRGLRRAHIAALPGNIGNAYAQEVFRYPDRRVKGLIENPHRLPANAPRPISMRRVDELTDEERRQKRELNRDAKRRSRKNLIRSADL